MLRKRPNAFPKCRIGSRSRVFTRFSWSKYPVRGGCVLLCLVCFWIICEFQLFTCANCDAFIDAIRSAYTIRSQHKANNSTIYSISQNVYLFDSIPPHIPIVYSSIDSIVVHATLDFRFARFFPRSRSASLERISLFYWVCGGEPKFIVSWNCIYHSTETCVCSLHISGQICATVRVLSTVVRSVDHFRWVLTTEDTQDTGYIRIRVVRESL